MRGRFVGPSPLDRLGAALAGRYTLERELGRGGMATVWLARELKHDRLVALKVLRPEIAAALGPARFLREITLTAGLDHPHLLSLLDSGEAEGFLYYTMPFVDGESLRERLTREKHGGGWGPAEGDGDRGRDAGVHESRAGRGEPRPRWAERSVLAGVCAVRDAGRGDAAGGSRRPLHAGA